MVVGKGKPTGKKPEPHEMPLPETPDSEKTDWFDDGTDLAHEPGTDNANNGDRGQVAAASGERGLMAFLSRLERRMDEMNLKMDGVAKDMGVSMRKMEEKMDSRIRKLERGYDKAEGMEKDDEAERRRRREEGVLQQEHDGKVDGRRRREQDVVQNIWQGGGRNVSEDGVYKRTRNVEEKVMRGVDETDKWGGARARSAPGSVSRSVEHDGAAGEDGHTRVNNRPGHAYPQESQIDTSTPAKSLPRENARSAWVGGRGADRQGRNNGDQDDGYGADNNQGHGYRPEQQRGDIPRIGAQHGDNIRPQGAGDAAELRQYDLYGDNNRPQQAGAPRPYLNDPPISRTGLAAGEQQMLEKFVQKLCFDGTNMSWRSFEMKFKRNCAECGWSKEMQARILPQLLSKSAADHYSCLSPELVADVDMALSRLKSRFGYQDAPTTLRMTLMRERQRPEEDIFEYYGRFYELAKAAYEDEDINKYGVEMFLMGVRDNDAACHAMTEIDRAEMCGGQNQSFDLTGLGQSARTLENALELVRRYQQRRKAVSRRDSSASPARVRAVAPNSVTWGDKAQAKSTGTKPQSESSSEMLLLLKDMFEGSRKDMQRNHNELVQLLRGRSSSPGRFRRDSGDRSRSPGGSPLKCFNCSRVGHIARDCTAPCGRCASTGHRKLNCPQSDRSRSPSGERTHSREQVPARESSNC